MFCKSCGKEIKDEAIMCVGCGCATGKTAPDTSKGMTQGELTCGYLGALFMPIIGVIVGIIALTRGKIGHGLGMIALSVCMCFFWIGCFEAMGQ